MSFRSLLAVAIAATLAVPAAATAQAKRGTKASAAPAARSSGSKQIWLGGQVGLELGTLDGFGLRADGEMPFKPLSPKVSLSGVGSVGYARLSKDVGIGEVSWNMFKIIPAARFTMPVAPQISLYGDAGLGLYFGSFKTKTTLLGISYETSDSATGFLMRFAAGGFYDLNAKTKLSAEIGVIPYFGDADTTNWTLGVGAMFAL